MSVNIISLNQIINLFSSFAQQHFFIKDFGYGPTSDIGTSRQMEFPYLWLSLDQQSSISVVNKTAIPRYGITILLMDKINIQQNYLDINGVNSDNSQEILSDTLQCLQDLITEIEVNWGNFGIKIDGDVSCFPAVDETPDKVCGWVGQFPMKVRHSNCITPMGNIVQTNLSPIHPFSQYLTCDTLPNCPTIINIENQLSGLTATTLTCNTLSGCTIIQDLQDGVITGGTFSSGTLQLFNGVSPIVITGFTDIYSTGGTYSNGTITIDLNDGSNFNITGLFTGYTNVVNTLQTGTGLSANTTSGNITLINTAPDQIVSLSNGTGISTSGTYPNFTITNTDPDQVVSITGGANISATGTYPNFTIAATGLTDYFVTGGTFSTSGGTLTLDRQNGSVSITGFTSNIGNFGITIDGGGSAITTGVKGSVVVPYDCYIDSWTIVSDVSGSIVVDVWKGTSPYTIPTSAAQSIAGSEKPTLSTQQINTDLNLTTWTTPLQVGDVLVFNVDSAATLTRATIQINVIKL